MSFTILDNSTINNSIMEWMEEKLEKKIKYNPTCFIHLYYKHPNSKTYDTKYIIKNESEFIFICFCIVDKYKDEKNRETLIVYDQYFSSPRVSIFNHVIEYHMKKGEIYDIEALIDITKFNTSIILNIINELCVSCFSDSILIKGETIHKTLLRNAINYNDGLYMYMRRAPKIKYMDQIKHEEEIKMYAFDEKSITKTKEYEITEKDKNYKSIKENNQKLEFSKAKFLLDMYKKYGEYKDTRNLSLLKARVKFDIPTLKLLNRLPYSNNQKIVEFNDKSQGDEVNVEFSGKFKIKDIQNDEITFELSNYNELLDGNRHVTSKIQIGIKSQVYTELSCFSFHSHPYGKERIFNFPPSFMDLTGQIFENRFDDNSTLNFIVSHFGIYCSTPKIPNYKDEAMKYISSNRIYGDILKNIEYLDNQINYLYQKVSDDIISALENGNDYFNDDFIAKNYKIIKNSNEYVYEINGNLTNKFMHFLHMNTKIREIVNYIIDHEEVNNIDHIFDMYEQYDDIYLRNKFLFEDLNDCKNFFYNQYNNEDDTIIDKLFTIVSENNDISLPLNNIKDLISILYSYDSIFPNITLMDKKDLLSEINNNINYIIFYTNYANNMMNDENEENNIMLISEPFLHTTKNIEQKNTIINSLNTSFIETFKNMYPEFYSNFFDIKFLSWDKLYNGETFEYFIQPYIDDNFLPDYSFFFPLIDDPKMKYDDFIQRIEHHRISDVNNPVRKIRKIKKK